MTDSEFIALAERALDRIETALEDALERSDADVDWSHNDGILEIVGGDGRKVIVNRHVPNREIWLAAPSGAFHFASDGDRWLDTRGTTELSQVVIRVLGEDLALAVEPFDLAAD
jgi:CyaY protein